MKQTEFFKKDSKAYGGELLKTRKGRSHGRPLDTKNTMHLVLRSSKAQGLWSFKRPKNEIKIKDLTKKFSSKYGIKVISLANVGNHLHFHIKLSNRFGYKPFIRALTASISMAVTGASRWKTYDQVIAETDQREWQKTTDLLKRRRLYAQKNQERGGQKGKTSDLKGEGEALDLPHSFWDYRPFTRIVQGFRAFLNLQDYLQINQLEGLGNQKLEARVILESLQKQWRQSS